MADDRDGREQRRERLRKRHAQMADEISESTTRMKAPDDGRDPRSSASPANGTAPDKPYESTAPESDTEQPDNHLDTWRSTSSFAPPAPDAGPHTNPTGAWHDKSSWGAHFASNLPEASFSSGGSALRHALSSLGPQIPKVSRKSKTPQEYRQRRIDRASELLEGRYRRITNETDSELLVDTHTGEVLPERLDAVAASIATDYRRVYQAEVSKSEINRAFEYFGKQMAPWKATVFYGRAGYDPQYRERYINVAPGKCLRFTPGESYFQSLGNQPCIRPHRSRPLHVSANIGNVNPQLIRPLFATTALPNDVDLLLSAWMILCWMPDRKQVMLELLGTPSAWLEKSQSLIKKVVDPSSTELHNEMPVNVKQFDVIPLNYYLLSFNQVEELTPTQQGHFYTLMRGKEVSWKWGGKPTGASIMVQCPIILNGLESVATTPKLANATLSIDVMDDELLKGKAATVPSAEGLTMGLLMIFGQVNSLWESVSYDPTFTRYGDLADLCRVGELVAEILQRDKAEFWQQFRVNQQGRREFELEELPVALAVIDALDDAPSGVIELSVKEWLAHLETYRPEGTSPQEWPTSSKGLAAKFKQQKPLLDDVGIILSSSGQRGPRRYWRAEKAGTIPSQG